MRQTFCISFLCRKGKEDRYGKSPIEASIVINGDRTYIALPRKEAPEAFRKSMSAKRDNEIKRFCEEARARINDICDDLATNSIPITPQNIKKWYKGGGINTYTIGMLFKEYQDYLRKRVGNDLTERTFIRYQQTVEMFMASNPDLSNDLPATTINNNHILNYKVWLSSKYQKSTFAGHLTKLKSYFIYAIEGGHLQVNPFLHLKIDKGAKEAEYLTQEELDKIRDKEIHNERISKVRDLFLFMCYTGLSYTDLSHLEPEDYKMVKGKYIISKERGKTGVKFYTMLLKDARKIAEKWQFRLPVISNARLNTYLKELGDICGIEKELHCHMARHTCGCYLLNNGGTLEDVAKVLGHTNLNQAKHYAKLLDNTLFNKLSKLDEVGE